MAAGKHPIVITCLELVMGWLAMHVAVPMVFMVSPTIPRCLVLFLMCSEDECTLPSDMTKSHGRFA